jgi:hypothetical protein
MVGPVDTQSYVDLLTGDNGEPVYEVLADYMLQTLNQTREVIDDFIKGLKGAEKAQAEKIAEQVKDYIKQLEKQKAAGGLAKFFKALGALGIFLAIVCAVLMPSPMTIAVLVVAVVMFLEPLISEATGHESIIAKGLGKLMEAMKPVLGETGAIVMSVIIMVVAAAACVALLAGGLTMLSETAAAAVKASLSTMGQIGEKIGELVVKMFANTLTQAQTVLLTQVLEYLQSAILIAQGGVGIAKAVMEKQAADLLYICQVDQTLIDRWKQVMEMISKDSASYQDFLHTATMMMSEIFR